MADLANANATMETARLAVEQAAAVVAANAQAVTAATAALEACLLNLNE